MTDKEIIIDGVDVSECEYCLKMTKYRCTIQQDVYKCLCEENPNCYFKQLKCKEQECEELKKELQALDEIEQVISNFPSKGIQDIPQTQIECTQYFLSVSEAKLQKILGIINKAKRTDK